MNGLAKDFQTWMTSNGYGVLEGLTGGIHLRYRLRNGRYFVTGSTPSKHTAVINAKSDVRKILGIASESPRAGKYRHEKQSAGYDGLNGNPLYAVPPEVERLRVAVAKLDARILELHPRRNADRLRELARRRVDLTDQLDRLGAPVSKPGIPAHT